MSQVEGGDKRTGADEVTHKGLKVAENPNLVNVCLSAKCRKGSFIRESEWWNKANDKDCRTENVVVRNINDHPKKDRY